MKFIIKESRFRDMIFNYLDELFPFDEINWQHPYEFWEDGTEGEDPSRIEFYRGDRIESDILFRYYTCDFFDNSSYWSKRCPMVDIENDYLSILDGYFNGLWDECFKEWFTNKFNLPIDTVAK